MKQIYNNTNLIQPSNFESFKDVNSTNTKNKKKLLISLLAGQIFLVLGVTGFFLLQAGVFNSKSSKDSIDNISNIDVISFDNTSNLIANNEVLKIKSITTDSELSSLDKEEDSLEFNVLGDTDTLDTLDTVSNVLDTCNILITSGEIANTYIVNLQYSGLASSVSSVDIDWGDGYIEPTNYSSANIFISPLSKTYTYSNVSAIPYTVTATINTELGESISCFKSLSEVSESIAADSATTPVTDTLNEGSVQEEVTAVDNGSDPTLTEISNAPANQTSPDSSIPAVAPQPYEREVVNSNNLLDVKDSGGIGIPETGFSYDFYLYFIIANFIFYFVVKKQIGKI